MDNSEENSKKSSKIKIVLKAVYEFGPMFYNLIKPLWQGTWAQFCLYLSFAAGPIFIVAFIIYIIKLKSWYYECDVFPYVSNTVSWVSFSLFFVFVVGYFWFAIRDKSE